MVSVQNVDILSRKLESRDKVRNTCWSVCQCQCVCVCVLMKAYRKLMYCNLVTFLIKCVAWCVLCAPTVNIDIF